jgi:Lrp/AsnC family transcriptional regulator, leucine-responsive regulatory protein
VAAITAMRDVRRCYSLSGPIDLVVEIEGMSAVALNQLRDQIATLAGVSSVTTALILKREKDG